jgi:hypothetical protein
VRTILFQIILAVVSILVANTDHHSPQTKHTNILLAIMSPRNEVFQAIPFDASSDANEPLIANGDAEEADHRLQEMVFSRLKFSYRLLGLLVGFFSQIFTLGANVLVITIWGKDAAIKTKTDIFVVSLLCTFFFLAIAFISGFLAIEKS